MPRKITPALYNLFLDNWLPEQFSIIGTGRTPLTDEQFRERLLEGVNEFSRNGKVTKSKWDSFAAHLFYQVADATDPKAYQEFGACILRHEADWKEPAQVVYYLAVAPNFFPIIASNIAKNKLAADADRVRIVMEKPFGHDLESAKSLNQLLSNLFEEKQIYRIRSLPG